MRLIGLLMLCGALAGCGTTPEERIQSAADVAQLCAYNASEALLIEKPEAEPALRLAANDLRRMEAQEKVGLPQLLGIVERLPADKLESPYGRLAVANGKLVLIRLGRSSEVANADFKPVATALREGIEMRIGPP